MYKLAHVFHANKSALAVIFVKNSNCLTSRAAGKRATTRPLQPICTGTVQHNE